jgi:hypothetical protein
LLGYYMHVFISLVRSTFSERRVTSCGLRERAKFSFIDFILLVWFSLVFFSLP